MLQSTTANFAVVALNTPSPTYYWRGSPLTEVLRLSADIDEDGGRHVRLRVQNTSNFDTAYAEMTAAGIVVKKAGGANG